MEENRPKTDEENAEQGRISTHSNGTRDKGTPYELRTRLRELIYIGEFKPGDHLRAEALAERLGVSRTPVRVALAVMANEGLVEHSNNRGYRVRGFSDRDILNAGRVRAELEGLAALIASERTLDETMISELRQIVDRGAKVLSRRPWTDEAEDDWYAANYEFHRKIVHLADNTYLRNALVSTFNIPILGDAVRAVPNTAANNPVMRPTALVELSGNQNRPPQRLIEAQSDHERIVGLILSGEGDRAAALMREHALTTRDRIAKHIKAASKRSA